LERIAVDLFERDLARLAPFGFLGRSGGRSLHAGEQRVEALAKGAAFCV
jgi:hypothetical protein